MIRLPNELEVMLVHDPNTDKSAASLNVHVGHLSDPDNVQGLAHFLEHLLFMGTTKYPEEDNYKEYLSQHAENCMEREIRAVDSEFKQKLQEDARRLFQIGKHTCSRQHPYWHFGTGNLITLKEDPAKQGINVRAELIAFYNKYYSASIMKVTILGRDSLDKLTEWAVDKFSEIRNLGITPPAFPNSPWTSKELLTTIYMKPVQDTHTLEIKFPFPDEIPLYKVKPSVYITHLLRHEGTGSILSFLKQKSWANGITLLTQYAGIGHQFLNIRVDLTKEGLNHHEEIIVIVFQYLELMRKNGVKDYIWDEIVSLASTAFRFQEKSKAMMHVRNVTQKMQEIDQPEWILSGSELIRERNDKLIQSCMDHLRIDNWRATIISQDSSIVPGGVFTETERWYGIEYHVANTNTALLERLANIERHPELHLPVPNEFIATDFETDKTEVEAPLSHPNLVLHTPLVRLWHKKDDTFWVPKVNMYFLLRTPIAYASPLACMKTALVIDLLNDSLTEQLYGAGLAGLTYNFNYNNLPEGPILSIHGYNHKANVLLEKIVRSLKEFKIDPERFPRIKDKVYRRLRNLDKVNPIHHAMYFLGYMNKEKFWSYIEQLEELDSITVSDCEIFAQEIVKRLAIEALIHGNADIKQAKEACKIVEEVLQPKSLSGSEKTMNRSRILPEGCKVVYPRATMDPANLNSAIHYYLQVETAPYKNVAKRRETRALTLIIAQILQEPCFNQLRTKEQLGYIIWSDVREDNGTLGLTVTVQSERDPIYIEHRIEDMFKNRIAALIESMTEEEFKRQVESIVIKKLEAPKNLKEESTKYWDQINSGLYEFDQAQNDAEDIRKVTLEKLREFFGDWIHPDAARVKKLSIHIRSQRLLTQVDECIAVNGKKQEKETVVEEKEKSEEKEVEIPVRLRDGTVFAKDEAEFKASLELSRAPLPSLDLSRYFKN
ncbi:Insulinase (Peptidase M16) [Gryganskiella cystojenkinii]|nr:Insulinase (Peptidase M16) [Gryganskiella cystojenkinii]